MVSSLSPLRPALSLTASDERYSAGLSFAYWIVLVERCSLIL